MRSCLSPSKRGSKCLRNIQVGLHFDDITLDAVAKILTKNTPVTRILCRDHDLELSTWQSCQWHRCSPHRWWQEWSCRGWSLHRPSAPRSVDSRLGDVPVVQGFICWERWDDSEKQSTYTHFTYHCQPKSPNNTTQMEHYNTNYNITIKVLYLSLYIYTFLSTFVLICSYIV